MITIPNDLQAFAIELAALAKKHGLNRISGEFWPGYDHEWRPAVRFNWLQGRHGAAADQITLTSEHTVVAKPTLETPVARDHIEIVCEMCSAKAGLPTLANDTGRISIEPANGWQLYPRHLCPKCSSSIRRT